MHGRGVAVVGPQPEPDAVPGVDGLVTTRRPGVGLVMMAADCLPVLLADPVAGVVAAAHAGRAGLVEGVLQEVVQVMRGLGADPARTTAVLGPAVCGACYELPEDLAEEVGRRVPGSRSTTRAGTPAADLAAGAEAVLAAAGVVRTTRVGGCTVEQPERFFSHRRSRRHRPARRRGLAARVTRREELAAGLAALEQRVAAACAAAGRDRAEVRVVAVSKTWPVADLALLVELGVTDFGENKDQEAAAKAAAAAGRAVALPRPAADQQGALGRHVRRPPCTRWTGRASPTR